MLIQKEESFCPSILPQAIKRSISTLNVTFNYENTQYEALNRFRNEIKKTREELYAQPYQMQQKVVFAYRFLFIAFALLFIALATIVFLKGTTWFCNMYFPNCLFAKNLISIFCLSLTVFAFLIASCLRAEREAVFHLIKKTKKKLAARYAKKQMKWRKSFFLIFYSYTLEARELYYSYQDALDKIEQEQENVLSLLHKVASSKMEAHGKEIIFNQAILELQSKLNLVLKLF